MRDVVDRCRKTIWLENKIYQITKKKIVYKDNSTVPLSAIAQTEWLLF